MAITNQVTVQRVIKVQQDVYNGSDSAMAKDLGLTSGTISRTTSGKVEPSLKTLTALHNAKHIKLAWLLGEGGDEIEFDAIDDLGDSTSRPILAKPSVAAPTLETADFHGLRRFTAPYYCKPERYWVVASMDFPEFSIKQGDYLLIAATKPRSVALADLNKLAVITNGATAQLSLIGADMVSAQQVSVCGQIMLVERDMCYA